MKPKNFLVSTVDKVANWAKANSLWFFSVSGGCCADEVLSSIGCRYDLERLGCLQQTDPAQADLLIVNGAISTKSEPHLKRLYESMLQPKYVIAIGSCASCGGPFNQTRKEPVIRGVDQVIPVDVYVPGCPPRPEAIMNGILKLQEKIREKRRV